MLYSYLLLYLFESPVKYLGFAQNFIYLGYLKDLLGFILIFYFFVINKPKLFEAITVFIILSYIVFEFFLGHSIETSVFGFKEYVPLIIGFLYWRKILNLGFFSDFAFWVILLGLVLEFYYVQLPWIGAEFNIMNYDVLGSKIVFAYDVIKRHSGFSPLYTMANCWISFYFVLSYFKASKISYKLCLILGLLFSAYLTYVRTEIVAILLFFMFSVFLTNKKQIKKNYILFIYILFILVPFLVPFSIYLEFFNNNILDNMEMAETLIGRLFHQWPEIHKLIYGTSMFFGLGPGLVGPGKFFGSLEFNLIGELIDNQFLYSILSFGIFALLIYIFLLKHILNYKIKNSYLENTIFGLVIFTFTLGIMQNFDPGLMLGFGVIFGYFKGNNEIR